METMQLIAFMSFRTTIFSMLQFGLSIYFQHNSKKHGWIWKKHQTNDIKYMITCFLQGEIYLSLWHLPLFQDFQIHPSLLSVLEYPASVPVMMQMFAWAGIMLRLLLTFYTMLLNKPVYLWPSWSRRSMCSCWSSFTLRDTMSSSVSDV